MTQDLDSSELAPIVVQRATSLPASDDGWSIAPDVEALSTRRGVGNDIGSTMLEMVWGEVHDPNRQDIDTRRPDPPLAVDDLVRLVDSSFDKYGILQLGAERWIGIVEQIDWSDPLRAQVKAVDLGICLARIYATRGHELDASGALLVDPGYLPSPNAIPGGDCSSAAQADGYYVYDRRGTGQPWNAYRYADYLLRKAMLPDLRGAPAASAIPWRLDPASPVELDYAFETFDPNGKSFAEIMDILFGARRGLTWRTTTAGGYAQVLVCDLDADGDPLDTEDDLGWDKPTIQERRDGYDYVTISGARPLVGITLWWTRGVTGGALEPDGWDPATADAALNTALGEENGGKPYDRPEWRRFRLRIAWDGSQYDGSASGSGTVGLRAVLADPETNDPPNGDRWFGPGAPPPTSLVIERDLPAGEGWTDSTTGPRQSAIVIAGAAGRWEDLSKECKPTPVGGAATSARSDQGTVVIVLGDTAEDADRIRKAVGANGTLLVTIGIREWAPLQAAWAAPQDAWSIQSPRVYGLRRPQLEEWLCLAGCVKGVTSLGALDTLATELPVRSDITTLRSIRDQLAVRFGRSITAVSITRQDIDSDWDPGDVLSSIHLIDGRSYPVHMPCAEVEYDWRAPRTTRIRWAPLIKETPSA